VEGVQWTAGAVGHAEWSGVSLNVILERAGLAENVKEIVFYGADCGVEHGDDEPTAFARSLPLDKALHPDTLLATHMNGEILEPSHGYPLRLIVPGWYGVASVKWLTRIEAATAPFQGYYQTVKYTIKQRTGGGVRTDIVGPMPVKSEIIRPIDGSVLGIGANRLFGMAWAGEQAVAAVEVSVDGGMSWQRAELQGTRAAYSWTAWEYLWETAAPGEYTLLARAISDAGHVQPMDHDPDRGGYLITFSRPINVRLDAAKVSQDFVGDVMKLQRDMAAVAQERSRQPLDADIAFMSGAGI
jgi:DMSO/TMAO reductase YedYZ molybdopterin-dependent catalytic subunit